MDAWLLGGDPVSRRDLFAGLRRRPDQARIDHLYEQLGDAPDEDVDLQEVLEANLYAGLHAVEPGSQPPGRPAQDAF